MTTYYSTMGQPIPEGWVARIDSAWREVRAIAENINSPPPDHVEMLNRCAELRTACWTVTRAIDDAWYYANKSITSAIDVPEKRPVRKSTDDALVAAIIAQLAEEDQAK